MTPDKTILVVGTFDTKDDELLYLCDRIRACGGGVLTIDVSVLGEATRPCDLSKHDVAEAAGGTIQAAIDSGDENFAMQMMARGAAQLAARAHAEGKCHGVLILGGSMGTDLALDVCCALPLGVPKYIVSTVSFSPLIPAERLPADVQMILWAGGLYGLNSVCKASLSQAAGAVLGAVRAVATPVSDRPLIGMTSFGKTALRYMVPLKPALEARGFEVAVFHATGMGGRVFESLAEQGAFACVFDFATQEIGNHLYGSAITAGDSRLTAAARAGIPQIVAPGCCDLVDWVGWHPLPEALKGLPSHDHNRLIKAVVLDTERRREVARAHCEKLAQATENSVFLMPTGGCGEWDRPGGDLHDAEGLAAFVDEMAAGHPGTTDLRMIDAHINDQAFADAALEVFDAWLVDGTIKRTNT